MAVDWSKLTLIDAYGLGSGQQGDTGYARYYMLAANITYRPKRGDSAPAGTLVSGWKVNNAVLDPIGPTAYIVSVQFSRYIEGSAVGKTYQQLKDKWEIQYGEDQFLFDENVYGITKLSESADASLKTFALSDYDLSGYVATAKDTSGSTITPQTPANWNTAVSTACPFTVRPHTRYLNQNRTCITVSVTLYRDASHGTVEAAIGKFTGVNNTSGTATFPEEFGVPLYTTAGKWLACGQTVGRVLDDNGDPFWSIQRTARMVPQGCYDRSGTALVWDQAKCGGYMVWPTWP